MQMKIIHWWFNKIRKAKPLHFDHVGVCLAIIVVGWLLYFISSKIGIFDPINAAFEDFYLTDVYYKIMHSDKPDLDEDIVIVDMTELTTRDEIAKVITDIKYCKPKVLCVDLIFERPSSDEMDDVLLLSSLDAKGGEQLLSCKLCDYNDTTNVFQNCLYSFFYDAGNKSVKWGYSNYHQVRMGGYTRETSVRQMLNDSIVYSLSYTAACLYQGKGLKEPQLNERQIIYDDVDFDTIKSCDVLQSSEKIRGKLVILGTLHEEADMHFTPLGKMAGATIVAYSIRTYIKGGEILKFGIPFSLLIGVVVWWIAAIVGYCIEKRQPIVFGIIAKMFNFVLAAFLVWISFELYAKFNAYIDLWIPLSGLALVEDIREMYSAFIKWLQNKTHWKIFDKFLYKNGG